MVSCNVGIKLLDLFTSSAVSQHVLHCGGGGGDPVADSL
jgi:hypothetical protein